MEWKRCLTLVILSFLLMAQILGEVASAYEPNCIANGLQLQCNQDGSLGIRCSTHCNELQGQPNGTCEAAVPTTGVSSQGNETTTSTTTTTTAHPGHTGQKDSAITRPIWAALTYLISSYFVTVLL